MLLHEIDATPDAGLRQEQDRRGTSRLRRVRRITVALLAGYGALALAIFYTPLADRLSHPLWVEPVEKEAQAIVVLTAWASPEGVLNEQAMRRIHTAARLFKRRLAPLLIISGGDPEAGRDYVASYMAGFAEELGVPRESIRIEGRSRNTHESAVNVAQLCRQLGVQTLILVTDAAHVRRASATMRGRDLTVFPVSSDPWSLGWETPAVRLEKFRAAIHEYGALLYYWGRGWI